MKTIYFFGVAFLLIFLALVFVSASFNQPVAAAQNPGAASIFLQTTPGPAMDDTSKIGSTDGIMVMGVIISLIVIVPILIPRKKN
jgi:hypothetical protein